MKTKILLFLLAIIVGGCGQKAKKQAETTNEIISEQNNEIVIEKNSNRKVKYYFRANGGQGIFFDDGTSFLCARCELEEDLKNYKPNSAYTEFPTYLLIDGETKWELYDESGRVTMDWVIVNYNTVFVNEETGIEYLNTEHYKNSNQIGLGVVNPKEFHFYFVTDTASTQKTEIENIETQAFFIPLIWKPDYGIFYMTVVGISGNWYEVQANAETTVWVNKSEFDFYTWENLLKDKTTCIIADIVYTEKDIHSESADMGEYEAIALIVEKVEDDWIFVKGEHLHIEDAVFDYSWVRWKDGNNKLLIQPIFLM